MNEFNANHAMHQRVSTRAQWAAVLAPRAPRAPRAPKMRASKKFCFISIAILSVASVLLMHL